MLGRRYTPSNWSCSSRPCHAKASPRSGDDQHEGVVEFDTYGAWLLERFVRTWQARGSDMRILDLPARYDGLLAEVHTTNRETGTTTGIAARRFAPGIYAFLILRLALVISVLAMTVTFPERRPNFPSSRYPPDSWTTFRAKPARTNQIEIHRPGRAACPIGRVVLPVQINVSGRIPAHLARDPSWIAARRPRWPGSAGRAAGTRPHRRGSRVAGCRECRRPP